MEPISLSLIIGAGIGLLFLASFLLKAIILVSQAQAVVIERLGRYDRTLGAGLHIIVPFIERKRNVWWTFVRYMGDGRYHRYAQTFSYIDLRETAYDFPKQNVITKDNVTMEINALLYYQITDPKAAVYEVANLPEAIEKLTQTTLRNVIGSLDLDESLVSRDRINEKLRNILDDATDKWGVKINRVELQEVNPPHDIKLAMEKQMRAERDRRALVLEAEGAKSAAILQAEGHQRSQILRSEGEAQARIINAQAEAEARLKIAMAEAQALEKIKHALNGADPVAYQVAMQYIKTLPKLMEGKNDKLVVIPYEASTMVAALASAKTIFEHTKTI